MRLWGATDRGEEPMMRAVYEPRPPSPRTVFWRIVVLCLGIRLVLQVVGMASLAARGQDVWSNALSMWVHWDANHYLRIAEIGYVTQGEDALYVGFFPLYPVAIRFVSIVLRDLAVSGLMVSLLASIGASWLLYAMVRPDAGHREAWRAVVLLAAFPTAFFLSAPYSEAMFLFAVLASVSLARRSRWGWAATAGAVATGTRPTGLALLPVLGYEALVGAKGWTQRFKRTLIAS
jgi:Gpi18-like mannosyltransferase